MFNRQLTIIVMVVLVFVTGASVYGTQYATSVLYSNLCSDSNEAVGAPDFVNATILPGGTLRLDFDYYFCDKYGWDLVIYGGAVGTTPPEILVVFSDPDVSSVEVQTCAVATGGGYIWRFNCDFSGAWCFNRNIKSSVIEISVSEDDDEVEVDAVMAMWQAALDQEPGVKIEQACGEPADGTVNCGGGPGPGEQIPLTSPPALISMILLLVGIGIFAVYRRSSRV